MQTATQQQEALTKIEHWYNDTDEQIFRLYGYAGTGKTTTAAISVDRLGLTIGVDSMAVAYTGKAAFVLQRKQMHNAQTIHKLIYQPRDKARTHLIQLESEYESASDRDKSRLWKMVTDERKRLESPDFVLVGPWSLRGLKLIVLDEVSMIDDKIAEDLLSFGIRVLALGDPMQLPPIDGPGYFMRKKPDYLLTDIHRTNISEVIEISMNVRESVIGDNYFGCPIVDGKNGRLAIDANVDLAQYDQIIVGTNAARWRMNTKVRQLNGLNSDWPEPTDKIVINTNSGDANVFNGQQFVVVSRDKDELERVLLTVTDDFGEERSLWVWKDGFIDAVKEREIRPKGRGITTSATWGYAITAHKAQGSEWDKILVVDEVKTIAGMKFKDNNREFGFKKANKMYYEDGRQWLYTAVTRAISQVHIVDPIVTW